MNKKKILDQIKVSGIVGAGGAGFPTYKKLEATVDTVIANAAECEPLLYSDKDLIKKKSFGLIEGIKLSIEIVGAEKGIIAIKEKHESLIQLLEKQLPGNIEIYLLPDAYPVGDEQVLVWEVLNRIVPEGGLPLDVGVVVQNVGTLFNIYNALKNNEPVTSRFVTVLGEVEKPFVADVAIGTSISYLIDYAGGVRKEFQGRFKILEGGPMTGKLVEDINQPITKTTSGIIILPENHYIIHQLEARESLIIKKAQSYCCMCKSCTEVCPRYLIGHAMRPDELMKSVSIFNRLDTTAYLCCECGLCEIYACPMDLSPRLVARQLKQKLIEAGIKNPHNITPTRVHTVREFRQIPGNRLIMKANLRKYKVVPDSIETKLSSNIILIPLKQHIGVPAKPVVKINDKVTTGQVIAKVGKDFLGADIHSSINGNVTEVTDKFIKIKK